MGEKMITAWCKNCGKKLYDKNGKLKKEKNIICPRCGAENIIKLGGNGKIKTSLVKATSK